MKNKSRSPDRRKHKSSKSKRHSRSRSEGRKEKPDRDRERDRERGKDREKDKERSKHKERDRERNRERDRDKEREKERERERERERDREREWEIQRVIEMEREREQERESLLDETAKQRFSRSSRFSSNQAITPLYLRFEDAEIYTLQMQITDITNKLSQQNYADEFAAMTRLPSPDPIYGPDGKRINTKEQRARERLENRKKDLMIRLHELRPDLVPNIDKITASRLEEKVFIPQENYPDINFAGLIIGPRGMTQKELEAETGTKIILRGKGSVKVGKMAGSGVSLPGEDEPLHAYITSHSRENIDRAVKKIEEIVQSGIEKPELENELRKNQMKQLAILNGTYRETEGLNKLKMLSEAQSIATNTIVCSLCGGTGHLPRDCKVGSDPYAIIQASLQSDGEYSQFINELGYVQSVKVDPTTQQAGGVSSFIKNFVFKS